MTVLWIFWGQCTGPTNCSSGLKAACSHLTGEMSMKCRAIIFGITEFFYFIDDSTGTWRSQGPLRRRCALRWLGGAPSSPPGPSLPCYSLRLDTVLSRPCALLCFPSLPAPLPCWSLVPKQGAHLRAFAHVASLVWNALCRFSHHLVPAYLTPPQRDPNLGVLPSLSAALLFGLDLPWDPHLCLRLPFLRQHHFFMTSPPRPPWILGIPASLSVPAPETNLGAVCVRQSVHLSSLSWKRTGDISQPIEIKCLTKPNEPIYRQRARNEIRAFGAQVRNDVIFGFWCQGHLQRCLLAPMYLVFT